MTPEKRLRILHGAERFFRAWARVVVRYPKTAIVATVVFTLAMGATALLRLRVNNSAEGLLGSDAPSMIALDRMTKTFGSDKAFVLIVTGDVFSRPFLEKLERLHHELETVSMDLPTLGLDREQRRARFRGGAGRRSRGPEIVTEDVTSLVNVPDPKWLEDGLVADGLLESLPADSEIPALRDHVLENPSWVGSLVDRTGRIALVHMRLRPMSEADQGRVRDRLESITAHYDAPDFAIRMSGHAAFEVSMNRIMQRDIILIFFFALAAMSAILYFLFRSAFGVMGPVLVILMSVVAAVGAMAIFDAPMTAVTSILAGLLVIIGLADTVHVQTEYRRLRKTGASNADAIVEAVGESAWPITFTAITDVVGLISFRLSNLQSVQDMGTYSSIGVMVALVHSLVFLPAFLTFHRKAALEARPEEPRRRDFLDRFIAFCEAASRPVWRNGRVSRRRRNLVLFAAAAIGVPAFFAAAQIRPYQDPIAWLPASDENRRNLEYLEDHLGGYGTVSVLVDAATDEGLRDRDLLERLDRFERDILAYRHPDDGRPVATQAFGLVGLVRQTWQALHDGDPRYRVVPDTDQGASDCMTLLEGAGPRALSRTVTADLKETRITIRVRHLEASAYSTFIHHLEETTQRVFGDAADVELSGTVYANYDVVTSLSNDLLASFGTAFLGIVITMILVVWDVKLGLLAVIPNLLPIMMMAAIMGVFRVPLDLTSLLVGSIAMGLVVDDTIHVLHYYVTRKDELGNERAVRGIFASTGRAIVGSSLTLVSGFSLYLFATMINVQRFGGLLSATILVALFGDLLLTPALLRTIAKCDPLPEDASIDTTLRGVGPLSANEAPANE